MRAGASRWSVPVAGVVAVALSIVGIATVGHSPSAHASPSEVVTYLEVHRAAVLRTMMLLSLANGAMLVFFAQLRSVLRAPTPTTLALVAIGVLCSVGAATTALPAAIAYYGPQGIDPATVALARQTYFAANAFSAMPAALAVGSIGVAIWTTAALPRWLAVASFAAAAMELTATFTLAGLGGPDGGLAVGGLFGSLTLWILVVSIVSALSARHRDPGSRASA